MKIVGKVAEKILGHCSKCGGCPMAKLMDAQGKTGGKDETTHQRANIEMIEVRKGDLSVDEIVKKMKNPKIGAIITYLGTVREFPEGAGLNFEEDKNAIQKLEEIRKDAIDKFDVEDVAIIHRVGSLGISENILLVAVSASHRWAAFDACQSIINDIKEFHKSWKKEVRK
jgi:molybdopterin synthase catalytic subunit